MVFGVGWERKPTVTLLPRYRPRKAGKSRNWAGAESVRRREEGRWRVDVEAEARAPKPEGGCEWSG